MKGTKTAKIMAMGIVCVIVLGVLPLVMAQKWENQDIQISVEPSGYDPQFQRFYNPYRFVPGDSIEISLYAPTEADDGLEDLWDLIVFPSGQTAWDARVKIFDDVEVDDDGDGSAIIDGTTTKDFEDGAYDVYVGPPDWIQNQCPPAAAYWSTTGFQIQLYQIQASTDRLGYIPGDDVIVYYSIISLKDGSLITDEAYDQLDWEEREWAVWSFDDETEEDDTLDESSGSFSFEIASAGSATDPYSITIWANASWGEKRIDQVTLFGNWFGGAFRVRDLNLNVQTDRPTYQIDSVVKVTVDTFVLGGPAYVPEPGVKVDIEILEGTGTDADEIDGYGGTFYSDATGKVVYAFSVDEADFGEDKTYTVRADVRKALKEDTMDTTFDVEAGGRAISVDMAFDKDVYTTGDTVVVIVSAAVPPGANNELTYLFRITDQGGGTRAQEVISSTSSEVTFNYDIPNDFEGTLSFWMTVANADGDSGTDWEPKLVHYAVLLLNAEPERYDAGNTITAKYELITTLVTSPGFFYKVTDSSGRIVLEGEIDGSATTGSFEYTVPDVPSANYNFYMYSNLFYEGIPNQEQGIWIETTDQCFLKSGYDLEISVDAPAYAPGERVAIHYNIRAKGDEGLPDKYIFSYGMSNGPMYSWQSSEPSGTIYYNIPGGVNQGEVLFMVNAYDGQWNSLGSAFETLTIKSSPNPLEYTRIGDVPLMGIILLILVIILILVMLFRRPSAAPAKPAAEKIEEAPLEEEAPPAAAPGEPSPLAINCKACGAEIEITTSKRPIEVMCPNCGETEMVE
jgi:hypothetical protein